MYKLVPLCLVAALAAMSGTAVAETLADQINTMNAQLQLLTKRAELQAALSRSAGFDMNTMPRVIAVYGVEKRLAVRLLLASGMISSYEEGDLIRGSMKVAAITPRAVLVTVANGKKPATIALDFVSPPPAATGGAQSGAPMPMPFASGVGPGGATGGGPLPPELLPSPPAIGTPLPAARPPGMPVASEGAAAPAR